MAPAPSYGKIFKDGLWTNNQSLVALLGLCPLLAVTTNTVNGLGLGLATMAVLVLSNTVVSLIRQIVRPEVRLPVFVLVIASFVTAVELAMQAYFHELHKVLGIFIPLIVTNCVIIGRAEAFASKHAPALALADGIAMGLGMTAVLAVLGALREIIGQGTLLAQAHQLFGEQARAMELSLGSDFHGLLITILPPGAFLGLGFLIALKNVIDQRTARKAAQPTRESAPGPAPSTA